MYCSSSPLNTERSRNKERLEASLAGLCELELLKQRQEALVLSALSLGDSILGCYAGCDLPTLITSTDISNRGQKDLTLRRQLSAVQNRPRGLAASLEQQVGNLRVDTDEASVEALADVGNKGPGSGDTFVVNQERIQVSGTQSMVPRSLTATDPSLGGITEGKGEEKLWSWVSSDHTVVDRKHTTKDYEQTQHVETCILGLIQRCSLERQPCKPRPSLGPDEVSQRSSLCCEDLHCTLEHQRASPEEERPAQPCESLVEQLYGCLHFTTGDQVSAKYLRLRQAAVVRVGVTDPCSRKENPITLIQRYQLPDSSVLHDKLVNAQYIPAQQKSQAPTRTTTHRPKVPAKNTCNGYNPERMLSKSKSTAKKCRFNEERAGARRVSRRACLSQTDNSLGQRGVSERKYNTLDRDGIRGSQSKSKRFPPGSTGSRRWCSTLELSQEETEGQGEQACRCKAPSTLGLNSFTQGLPCQAHHTKHLRHTPLCKLPGYSHPVHEESESSLSAAESLGSSSLSSESEESGGLVWPQQLPPQRPSPSGGPLQQNAFVKIKASHALKKKILRFHTGSLKVMTTV